jgi:hypothetical protein
VALAYITDEEKSFVSHTSGLLDAVKSVFESQKSRALLDGRTTDFSGLVAAIREYYEKIILAKSVRALVNIYQFEMVRAENGLKGVLTKRFAVLEKEIERNTDLRDFVHRETSDEGDKLYKLAHLAQKIHTLCRLTQSIIPLPDDQPVNGWPDETPLKANDQQPALEITQPV